MYNTLTNLNKLIDNTIPRNMDFKELCEKYRVELNPSLLALAYKRVFPLILTTSQKFFGLSESDIASFALEELDYALTSYDINSELAKFTTYFTRLFYCRLRTETKALNMDKRKASTYADSYDIMLENGFDTPLVDKSFDDVEFYKTLEATELTNNERTYCQLICQGYKNSDIAKLMNVSAMTLSNLRKKLRKKLSNNLYENVSFSI